MSKSIWHRYDEAPKHQDIIMTDTGCWAYRADLMSLETELERTHKALELAKKYLMEIGYLNMLEHGLGSERMMTDWCKTVALHALKEIETALEQKDK